jgi:hypothetical protein
VALLGLVCMTWLLRQTDILDDPHSPLFFGYSGIGFWLGILWDVLTAGSWANEGTEGLPRVSRVLMYVGYVLLTVSVVNRALTGHDLSPWASSRATRRCEAGPLRQADPLRRDLFDLLTAGRAPRRGRTPPDQPRPRSLTMEIPALVFVLVVVTAVGAMLVVWALRRERERRQGMEAAAKALGWSSAAKQRWT